MGQTKISVFEDFIARKVVVKVRSFKEHSYTILISLKTMTIFNNPSADITLMSADVSLKMVIVLSEMWIELLCS